MVLYQGVPELLSVTEALVAQCSPSLQSLFPLRCLSVLARLRQCTIAKSKGRLVLFGYLC